MTYKIPPEIEKRIPEIKANYEKLTPHIERIVGVAICYPEGVIWLPAPARHHHIIKVYHEVTGKITKSDYVQGFRTNRLRFVNRAEALQIAYEGGQMKPNRSTHSSDLFSEDLW